MFCNTAVLGGCKKTDCVYYYEKSQSKREICFGNVPLETDKCFSHVVDAEMVSIVKTLIQYVMTGSSTKK